MPDSARPDPASNPSGASADDWAVLSQRLGIDPTRIIAEGPVRGPLAGPSDETPLEKTMRLSAQMEQMAAEIASVRSITYRAQLWQQWDALWRGRPEYRAWLQRVGPAAQNDANPFV